MPVRSLTSCVLKWPDRQTVVTALKDWVASEVERHPELLRLGYFGSYARGNWGVGSDLDLVAVVAADPQPFERRAVGWRTEELPVATDLLVYTQEEWGRLSRDKNPFISTLEREVVWVWGSDKGDD